jgi:inner membrane protein
LDSLTHIALGAAIGTAVLGRKAGLRAAAWGAVCATLPDLDVLVPYGDPVRDFTFHRSHSHSLFWLTLATPAIAWIAMRTSRVTTARLREWITLVWLALITHPLLDAFTVYGTQLLQPFTDYPIGIGSVFIIDPLFTIPLLIGLGGALRLRASNPQRARRWSMTGIAISAIYLGWTVAVQSHVAGVVNRTLADSGSLEGRVLVTPTPFNSLLWRTVVMDDGGYLEGFHSILDEEPRVELVRHESASQRVAALRDEYPIARLAWFSKGFLGVSEIAPDARVAQGSASTMAQVLGMVATTAVAGEAVSDSRPRIVVSDLRMGQTPWFVFSFVVGAREGERVMPVPVMQLPTQRPPTEALGWLWRRMLGDTSTPTLSATGPAAQAPNAIPDRRQDDRPNLTG